MLYAGFQSLADATAHRTQLGGWIFVPSRGGDAILWFSLGFTPTAIFTHPMTRGMDGALL